MLAALYIDNFAVVEHLELDFTLGMTVFTGETGAGKSIMIDALILLLGGRADPSVIRLGANKCEIIATFWIADAIEPLSWIAKHDLDIEDNTVILKRTIFLEGRSKCYINGQPFAVQKIKELGAMLVHIHGQHEHQSLLQHAIHRQHLDQFAINDLLLQNVANTYKLCKQIQQKLEDLQYQTQQNNHVQLLEYQLEELNALNLQSNTLTLLNNEHQLLNNAQEYINIMQQINQLLNSETETNVTQQLAYVLVLLNKLPKSDNNNILKNLTDLITAAHIQCIEAINEVNTVVEKISLNPERLQIIETQIQEIYKIARKYNIEAKDIKQYIDKLNNELALMHNAKSNLFIVEQEYNMILEQYKHHTLLLRESRKNAAPKLAQEITKILNMLAMPHGRIVISMEELEKMQSHGADHVEYLVQTNPGLALDALQKIASGGELSRISLAIQLVTSQQNSTPTIIFDEVDVGIGGATAALIGKLLRDLGERLQVFCVTHQPQVAVTAHNHFVVKKYNKQQQTYSKVFLLSEQDKVEEISRMMSGVVVTEQTRSHARELLLQGQDE